MVIFVWFLKKQTAATKTQTPHADLQIPKYRPNESSHAPLVRSVKQWLLYPYRDYLID